MGTFLSISIVFHTMYMPIPVEHLILPSVTRNASRREKFTTYVPGVHQRTHRRDRSQRIRILYVWKTNMLTYSSRRYGVSVTLETRHG